MAKLISWFTTNKGKIFTRCCVGFGSTSVFAWNILTLGPWQEKVKELCQLYDFGKPKPLPERVQRIISEVLNDCNLNDEDKKKLKFFNVIGEDLFHIGGINSPWGAMIGIPFYYDDKINFGKLRLKGQDSVDWIVDGPDLLEALSLSDKAMKFGVMREIVSCNIWEQLDNAAIAPFCILVPAEFARRINKYRDAFNKVSFKNRFALYVMCSAMGLLLYRLIKDPLEHLYARKYDKLAAEKGTGYLEGGIEFYEKSLSRNKALRNMLGKAGEKKFDKDGNENYLLLAPKLPVAKRLELLKELQKSQVVSAKVVA